MIWHEGVDLRRAFAQWEALVGAVQGADGRVDLLPVDLFLATPALQ